VAPGVRARIQDEETIVAAWTLGGELPDVDVVIAAVG
jgi:hypothetical protein